MFHASAVPDLAEPRKRTLLVAGVTGAGPVAIIVFPPNLSGQTFPAKILPAKILPAWLRGNAATANLLAAAVKTVS
ncbi:MAG: hypothetical protein ABSD11_07685 [Methylocella sp.]|jgi:hypothetical protein